MNTITKIGTWNAVVHLPASYAGNPTKTYPAIYFFPGLGEVGVDVNKLLIHGPNAYIAAGWDGKVGTTEFIVISLQPPTSYPRPNNVKIILDAAEATYRIDKSRVALTGLSHGAWVANEFATYKPTATDFSYMDRAKIVVNVQGVQPSDTYGATEPYPQKFATWATRGGKELGFEQSNDGRGIDTLINTMNAAAPASGVYIKTAYNSPSGVGGHGAFEKFFGAAGTIPVSFPTIGTLYQWIDSKLVPTPVTPPPPPPNDVPLVNAGPDQVITLPTTTATLEGGAIDSDGTIAKYNWAILTTGAGLTITDPTKAITTVTGLKVGEFVFELTATDDKGATSKDSVKITVQPSVPIKDETWSHYTNFDFNGKLTEAWIKE